MQRLPLALTALLITPLVVTGKELPLWEAGMGVLPSTFPSYRGSKDQQNYLLPLPYIVYRGDILKVDREGIRAQLFDSDRLQLNISMNGSVPVSSDDSNARRGMPDLNPTFEIGPSLNIRLADINPQESLNLRLPLRAVIATDFSEVDHAGWLFYPHVNYNKKGVAGGWNVGVNAGPLFASQDYHAYYYDIAPAYVTPTRHAYTSKSGYSGMTAVLSASRHYDQFWMGGFLRYDNLAGAVFTDSPLVETQHSFMAGFAVAWIFSKSSTMVSP